MADVVVIGAGFAGPSAARRLVQLDPALRVMVRDAQAVAEITGSRYYRSGLYTSGTLLLQPAGLKRSGGQIHLRSPVSCCAWHADEHRSEVTDYFKTHAESKRLLLKPSTTWGVNAYLRLEGHRARAE